MIDERHLEALDRLQKYQRHLACAYNKRVKEANKQLKTGDSVLKMVKASNTDPRGKFRPNLEGLYVVKKVLQKGATKIIYMDGNKFMNPINIDKLKRYFI